MAVLYQVFYAGDIFMRVVIYAMLIYCILSWFRPTFRAYDWLGAFVQPFVAPFRWLSMKLMSYFRAPVDFSYLFAIIAIEIIERLWWQLYLLLARAL